MLQYSDGRIHFAFVKWVTLLFLLIFFFYLFSLCVCLYYFTSGTATPELKMTLCAEKKTHSSIGELNHADRASRSCYHHGYYNSNYYNSHGGVMISIVSLIIELIAYFDFYSFLMKCQAQDLLLYCDL